MISCGRRPLSARHRLRAASLGAESEGLAGAGWRGDVNSAIVAPMRQTLLVAGISALAGSLGGVGATAWLHRDASETRPLSAPSSDSTQVAARAAVDDALLRRIESIERALRNLEAQGTSPERQSSIGRPEPRVPPALGPAAPPVSEPVFEAAVLDVLARAEEDRDAERSVRRSERAQEQAEHWTQELTRHLTLSPHQAAQVRSWP